MKESRLNQLFAAARRETPPPPAVGFANRVLNAVRREPSRPTDLSWLEQITAWAPRLALGSALLIAACVATDFAVNAFGLPTLTEGVTRISNDWLLTSTPL